MTRRTVVVVGTDGRDKGKNYFIQEMDAWHTEEMATRAYMAMRKAGNDLSTLEATGASGIAQLGLAAFTLMDYRDARPLMDEMMMCVSHVPDPRFPDVRRPLVGPGSAQDDVEETLTIWMLRDRVYHLHMDFSSAAAPSPQTEAA
jgi:hypothetical protein